MKWYEQDGLLTYCEKLKHKQFDKDPDKWFSEVTVVNFDVIPHECGGNKL